MAQDRARFDEALNKGHSYVWDQRWQEAIEQFQIAIAEAPQKPAPYAGLGDVYQALAEYSQALENYKLAARYSRGNITYLRNVAAMQEKLNLNDEAGKTFMAIGEMELGRRNLKAAMDNWHRAVNLEPNLLRAHQRLASIYQRQGATRNAIEEYLSIARILQSQGENDKALQTCKLALKLDPRAADVLTAIEMIKQGESLAKERKSTDDLEEKRSTGLLQRMGGRGSKNGDGDTAVPVEDARRLAMSQLAGGLFSDDETGETTMNKMERDALISKALDFHRRGKVDEAISCYEPAMQAGEDSSAAHFNLGLLYQDKLRFDDAIEQFEISAKDHNYRLASYYALGEAHRARGRSDKAVENFIQVLKIVDLGTVQHDQADRLMELYENLADSLIKKGEHEQATNFSNTLVDFLSHRGWEDKAKKARKRLDTISDAGMMILGDVLTAGSDRVLESLYLSQEYTRRGFYNTALEETFLALQLSPDYMPTHIQLAEILGKQGRTEVASEKFTIIANTFVMRGDINGAVLAYERVLEMSPLDIATRLKLIDLLKSRGQIDRALRQYMAIGESYDQLAQVNKARETYQKALKLAPRGSAEENWRERILTSIAEIDMQRFQWQRALNTYKELRKLRPDDERTAITLVNLHYRVGQNVNAVRELDAYLKQLVLSKRSNKIVSVLEDIVQQQPGDANLVERLYKLYLQQGRKADAIRLLDQLGESQLDENNLEAAIITIGKILKLNPPNAESYQQLIASLRKQLPD